MAIGQASSASLDGLRAVAVLVRVCVCAWGTSCLAFHPVKDITLHAVQDFVCSSLW